MRTENPDVFEQNGFRSPAQGLTWTEAEKIRWAVAERFIDGEISSADTNSIEKAVSLTAMEYKYKQ